MYVTSTTALSEGQKVSRLLGAQVEVPMKCHVDTDYQEKSAM
jgi:hypothetical protein